MTPERRAVFRRLAQSTMMVYRVEWLELLDALAAAEAERDEARNELTLQRGLHVRAMELLEQERDSRDTALRERDEARAELLAWKFRSAESGT